MGYDSTITFGSLTLEIDRITVRKVAHTAKQIIGMDLKLKPLPTTTQQDWSITIEGRHRDTNRATDRATLEGYDDMTTHTLTDGIHDGDYYILDLSYEDDPKRPTSYKYTLTLIQE